MRCFECNRFIWWGTGSNLSIGIHRECHQKIINEAVSENPKLAAMMRLELMSVERDFGFRPNVAAPDR